MADKGVWIATWLAALAFLCTVSEVAMAIDRTTAPRPAADQTAPWWGHRPSHHGHHNKGKTAQTHKGRRPISTHPERRRQFWIQPGNSPSDK
jgi:hypothetical protein